MEGEWGVGGTIVVDREGEGENKRKRETADSPNPSSPRKRWTASSNTRTAPSKVGLPLAQKNVLPLVKTRTARSTTRLFQLSNCVTTITSSQLHDLPEGALNMKGGSLSVETSTFHDNSPKGTLFPSARRNILCSENGKVNVGSLSSGDGSADKHPHLWLSSSDCVLSGEDVNTNAPFFVPTLSSDSTSSWNKKEKEFDVTILGTTLIPCGLFLEVFDVRKDSSEGESFPIELTQQSAVSFTETNITFTLPASSLADLDSSAEWRGRLVFGLNQKTRNSFQIKMNSSGRLAESAKENMKWWLPLVLVLSTIAILVIVILVVLMRRRRRKDKAKTQKLTESMELDVGEEDMKIEDTSQTTTDRVDCTSDCTTTKMGSVMTEEREPSRRGMSEAIWEDEMAMACGVDGKEVKVLNKHDTLFNRLHHPQPGLEIEKDVVRKQILSTLQSISGSGRNEFILKQLSPHEIFFDLAGVVGLNMQQHPHHEHGADQLGLKQQLVQEHALQIEPTSTDPEMVEQTWKDDRRGMSEVGLWKKDESGSVEGDSWKAPEVMMGKKGVRSESAAVFSFGLILWELETLQIPFTELDALNAHRQLKTGQPLPMDGIESPELVEMIRQCVDVDPAKRPSLSDLEKFLNLPSLHRPSHLLTLNPAPFVDTFQRN
ncbi:hypothetical protein BLNAU_7474 [Blattamonas nauphoetae]|uniref:Protein kinase domain-containing protein n=1 Tax=Blattamonas nauphoetae TaxID=2049346 RepID=A0ABQ9Y1G8_9EUKA|nr:hypothetical protein BLNAU_7474 [Blattamonas nauphoetae]